MMKVLLITDNHTREGGGAEKHFFTLKQALKNYSGIQVTSLGFGSCVHPQKDERVLSETSFKAFRQLWRLFLNPLKYWQIRTAINQIRPDIIHIHNLKKYTPSL